MAGPPQKKAKGGGGAPGWIVTFADLMSLLLTFFILILSFSSTDKPKFKAAMGSVQKAFGVQSQYFYENQLSSKDPIDASFKMDSDSLNQNREPQLLSAKANQFCEMEEDRRAKEQEYLVDVANTVIARFRSNELIQKFFKFRVVKGAFHVSVRQEKMFKEGEITRQAAIALKELFDGVPKEHFNVHVTNYSSRRPSSSSFKERLKLNQRAFTIAAVAQEVPSARRHNFIVESRTQQNLGKTKVQPDGIQLRFKFNKNK